MVDSSGCSWHYKPILICAAVREYVAFDNMAFRSVDFTRKSASLRLTIEQGTHPKLYISIDFDVRFREGYVSGIRSITLRCVADFIYNLAYYN